jgi:hypothetical protein
MTRLNARVKAGVGALATLGSLIAIAGTCLAIHAFARSPRSTRFQLGRHAEPNR